ncbi:MAG: NAD(P)H-binding protein [Tetragenococcus sp.]|nr:NAD(P)H-binding protein [Tetragenococcus sp.]
MKIAVVAANGRAGKLITNEAIKRNHDVTAIVRHKNQTEASHVLQKDLYDLTAQDLEAFDIVVDAFGVWDPAKMDLHDSSLMHLADCLSGTNTQLFVVGGAGSLYVDPEHKKQLKDTPDFPKEARPVAVGMGKALEHLKERSDVQWVYVSPAASFEADGAQTGDYTITDNEYVENKAGESKISYSDYATGFVDAMEAGKYNQVQISIYQN